MNYKILHDKLLLKIIEIFNNKKSITICVYNSVNII